MFEILNKQILSKNVKRLDINAPQIANKIRPGHFVSVCMVSGEEYIPLTVIEVSPKKGSIALIVKEDSEAKERLGGLPIKEHLHSILGPLGNAIEFYKKGMVVCVSTGIGSARMLSICRALKKSGNKVISIIGAKTKRDVMLETQMRLSSHKIYIATEDGSYDRRGQATDILKDYLDKEDIQEVYAIGSVNMLEAVTKMTLKNQISTRVHLYPVMVDCVGLCGSCRIKVGGKTVLGCVEGPEYDGHKIDFNDYRIRLKAFGESAQWDNQKYQLNQVKSESKTLTKFLKGILKK